MFIGKFNKSIIITYVGVMFAIIGMYFASISEFKYSILCLIVAGVCDMFDGKVARMCKRDKEEKLFGIELDSLADTIDFVVFPSVFGLCLGLNEWYHVLGYILLGLGGIHRLAFFNVLSYGKNDDGPVKFYSGLPVTSTSIIFPLIYVISNFISIDLYHILYIILIYLTAFLFVLNIKVPKLKGVAYPVVAIIALVSVICLLVM